MFERRKAAKAQAQQDEEWRSLVRAITDPERVVSERDEVRFLTRLGEHDDANRGLHGDDPCRGRRERLTGPKVERSQQDGDREREEVED